MNKMFRSNDGYDIYDALFQSKKPLLQILLPDNLNDLIANKTFASYHLHTLPSLRTLFCALLAQLSCSSWVAHNTAQSITAILQVVISTVRRYQA